MIAPIPHQLAATEFYFIKINLDHFFADYRFTLVEFLLRHQMPWYTIAAVADGCNSTDFRLTEQKLNFFPAPNEFNNENCFELVHAHHSQQRTVQCGKMSK